MSVTKNSNQNQLQQVEMRLHHVYFHRTCNTKWLTAHTSCIILRYRLLDAYKKTLAYTTETTFKHQRATWPELYPVNSIPTHFETSSHQNVTAKKPIGIVYFIYIDMTWFHSLSRLEHDMLHTTVWPLHTICPMPMCWWPYPNDTKRMPFCLSFPEYSPYNRNLWFLLKIKCQFLGSSERQRWTCIWLTNPRVQSKC